MRFRPTKFGAARPDQFCSTPFPNHDHCPGLHEPEEPFVWSLPRRARKQTHFRKSVCESFVTHVNSVLVAELPIFFCAQDEAYIVSAATTSTGSNMPFTNAGLGTFVRIPLSTACRQHLTLVHPLWKGQGVAFGIVPSQTSCRFILCFRSSDFSIFVCCVASLNVHWSLDWSPSLAAKERALRTAGLSDNWLEEWVRGKDLKTI